LSLCFPCAAYELRHSLGLALLTKWLVFLQNAFGNPAYVNQTILKLTKKLGGQAKIWGGHGPFRTPLRIATGLGEREGTKLLSGSRFYADPQLTTQQESSRRWLNTIHRKKSVLFCSTCKLRSTDTVFAKELNDWKHVSIKIREHETSTNHRDTLLSCCYVSTLEHAKMTTA